MSEVDRVTCIWEKAARLAVEAYAEMKGLAEPSSADLDALIDGRVGMAVQLWEYDHWRAMQECLRSVSPDEYPWGCVAVLEESDEQIDCLESAQKPLCHND